MVNGTQPLYVHVERASDIRAVLALRSEFPRLLLVLVGCGEGWLAFAAISSIPAEIMGMGERFGSLKPGRAGDVVIWDGDPLEGSSGVVAVYIDGVAQSLVNHQTRLRDRYKTPGEGSLPKAYDW